MRRRGPTLRRHRDGRGIATFNGRQLTFGRFDDPEARVRFAAFVARWEANSRHLPEDVLEPERSPLTATQLADGFVEHLKAKHNAEWLANNLASYESAMRPLREHLGALPARELTPKKLRFLRDRMIATPRSDDDPRPRWCRSEINRRMRAVKAALRWAVSEELVRPEILHGANAIDGLRAGEHGTREGKRRQPVPEEHVREVLPFLSSPVAAVVELLLLTGARPSELLDIRPCDIDKTPGNVWIRKLDRHKNAKRGKVREIVFGPAAQEVLRRFLDRVPRPTADRPLFSPRDALAEQNRARRAQRETPLYPSHAARYERERAGRPERVVGDRYDTAALGKALDRAIAAANEKREAEGREPMARWTLYALRHAAALRIRREHGLEAARALLGHAGATMTEWYAAVDSERARRAMEQSG